MCSRNAGSGNVCDGYGGKRGGCRGSEAEAFEQKADIDCREDENVEGDEGERSQAYLEDQQEKSGCREKERKIRGEGYGESERKRRDHM